MGLDGEGGLRHTGIGNMLSKERSSLGGWWRFGCFGLERASAVDGEFGDVVGVDGRGYGGLGGGF